ncbi:hypothetical protein AYI70_g2424 [Smittium culicis]|uniref:Uncharacterized protein n=1 Tax=Smittium culicis TaxID=133412 RepID=A0A1R1Y8A1_9FUNG|nr:hypothetical protein AYI70_g2424 [Smittium culicis]
MDSATDKIPKAIAIRAIRATLAANSGASEVPIIERANWRSYFIFDILSYFKGFQTNVKLFELVERRLIIIIKTEEKYQVPPGPDP